MAGPPLTQRHSIHILQNAGVLVGLGVPEEWQTKTILWEAAWAKLNSNGELSRLDAIAWVSTNLENMFGLEKENERVEFVAYEVSALLDGASNGWRCSCSSKRK